MLDTLPVRTRSEAAKDERRRVAEQLDELAAEVTRRNANIIALDEPSSAALFHVARALRGLSSLVRAEIDGMEAPKETTR